MNKPDSEHLKVDFLEDLLQGNRAACVEKSKQHSVVLACAENEKHQVGIKMVGDIFEKKGWDSFFLGAGIPSGELIRFIRQVKPDLLAISFSVYFNQENSSGLARGQRG